MSLYKNIAYNENRDCKNRGIALFISILLSMSLSVISFSAMLRLSSVSQTTGASIQDKKLQMYAESAVSIVAAEVQQLANADITLSNNTVYYISGPLGDFSYKFYPRDVTVPPTGYFDRTLFGYRAVARRIAGVGNQPSGLREPILDDAGHCFDITVDVREAIFIDDASSNVNADSSFVTAATRYYLGKTKTVGVVSCFIATM